MRRPGMGVTVTSADAALRGRRNSADPTLIDVATGVNTPTIRSFTCSLKYVAPKVTASARPSAPTVVLDPISHPSALSGFSAGLPTVPDESTPNRSNNDGARNDVP